MTKLRYSRNIEPQTADHIVCLGKPYLIASGLLKHCLYWAGWGILAAIALALWHGHINGILWWLLPIALVNSLALIFFGSSMLQLHKRRSNWLMLMHTNKLDIKLRSDLNAGLAEPHPTVIHLEHRDIAWARITKEWTKYTPLGGKTRTQKARYLDLGLNLNPSQQKAIAQAIAAEIAFQPSPDPNTGRRNYTLARHYPVQLENGVLRLEWRIGLRPKLSNVLQLLSSQVPTEPPLELKKDLSLNATAAKTDQQALELLKQGQTMAAIALIRRREGISLKAAREWAKELLKSTPTNNQTP